MAYFLLLFKLLLRAVKLLGTSGLTLTIGNYTDVMNDKLCLGQKTTWLIQANIYITVI